MHRIQKIMSMLGLVSRRDAEKLINAKKIRINGKFATIGQKIFINDVLLFKNKKYVITYKLINTKIQLLAYHKRHGEIVTKKTIQTNNTVFENLPKSEQIHFLPNFSATAAVVPEPTKKSQTIPSFGQDPKIILSINFSGF